MTWRIERITGRHERRQFDCGSPELDDFLARYARQSDEKDLARTYVALRPGESRVCGYVTLRSGSVTLADLPEKERRGLPRYPVPVVHLARLAADRRDRGQRLGERLLVEALRMAREVAEEIGVRAVEVVAETEKARRFYLKYGFRPLVDDRLHLYLSMKTIRQLPFD